MSRRAYNLAVQEIKIANRQYAIAKTLRSGGVNAPLPTYDVVGTRQKIRKIISRECRAAKRPFFSVICDEAVDQAFRANDAVKAKRKEGRRASLGYRRAKSPRQGFVVEKMSRTPYPRLLGGCFTAEAIPDEAAGRMASVVHENGRWFVCVKRVRDKLQPESQGLRIVAVDPGVRTFLTTFSPECISKIGDGFNKGIYELCKRLDNAISARDRFRARIPRDWRSRKQVHWDYLNHFEKKVHKLRAKIQDLIRDLHLRAIHWLTENYDLILLPTFEVKQMTRRNCRKIRKKSVRQMLALGHFEFKQLLKSVAERKGVIVVDVNEAYTSKTDSRTGAVKQNLAGQKRINGVDRDINGARGILLRALTKGNLRPETRHLTLCS